jgi:hypothetical protein
VEGGHHPRAGRGAGYAPQVLTATVTEPGLSEFLGKPSVAITFPIEPGAVALHWALMNPAPGATVLLRADDVATCADIGCTAAGDLKNRVPLAVKVKLSPIGARGGNVVFTSFHNISQASGDTTRILEYLVFNL